MSVTLALVMAATAALLATSVCAVLWRGKSDRPYSDAPDPSKATLPRMTALPAPTQEAYRPPTDALQTAQLEVGQTFSLQTATAKYVLTLRDPAAGIYDAVREGPKRDGSIVKERFLMIFSGTFVPYQGLRFGWFIPGGNLVYQKIRDGQALDVTPSTPIRRILFSIPHQQAS